VGGKRVEEELKDEGKVPDPRNPLFPDTKSMLGEVTLQPGKIHLVTEATKVNSGMKTGIHLRQIVLVPAS